MNEESPKLNILNKYKERAAGILLPIFSLPSPYGIGTFGKAAYIFADFLKQSGQKYWQVLPLGPTGYGDSPYQSFCSFAGNPYFIDLDILSEEGLLEKEDIEKIAWYKTIDRIDYGIIYNERYKILYKAYCNARNLPKDSRYNLYSTKAEKFYQENNYWLSDYSLFMSVKEYFANRPWTEWPHDIKIGTKEAKEAYHKMLSTRCGFFKWLQFKFYEQWFSLKQYINSLGIKVIGDIPIYVPLDSVDVWANSNLFQLDQKRKPIAVAGVPPDGFSSEGQLWGNPLYNWEEMKKDNFLWWINRLNIVGTLFDTVRFDHFRGIDSYWSIPYGDKTAQNGQWKQGPGKLFIDIIKKALPDLDIIAEDLGYLTESVKDLLKYSKFPGMKVLEFAFDSRESSCYLPHTYTNNCICYTGTHDNTTLATWFLEISAQDKEFAKTYLGLNKEEGYCKGMIRGGMSSIAKLFIAQMQDYLELGSNSRINCPGISSSKNWSWRLTEAECSISLAKQIKNMCKTWDR